MHGVASEKLNTQTNKGLFWSAMDRGLTQGVNFIIQLVLARLLCPEDYGVLTILSVFINLSSTFVNNGLSNALIQKKKSDEVDMSTVFITQTVISIFFMIVLFFSAPFIADFYENQMFIPYLRVMSITLMIDTAYSMQFVKLRIGMEFKKAFFADLAAIVAQAFFGIGMAYFGYGVWSLIVSQLVYKGLRYLVLQFTVKWLPQITFSLTRLRELWSYSWKLFIGWLIGTLHQDLYSLLVGRYFSTETLGYYNRGRNLPATVSTIVSETVTNVMFPALSKVQDDREVFKMQTRNMMILSAYLVFPLVFGIAAVSESFVMVVLTEKWAPSISMMQLFCISYGLNMISSINMQSFSALGRSDLFLKLEVVKRTLSVALLILACIFLRNIYAVISIIVLMGLFSLTYNAFMNKKHLNYLFTEQFRDILPSVLASVLMFLIAQIPNLFFDSYVVRLILQIATGIVFYFSYSIIFKLEGFSLVKGFIFREKKKKFEFRG